MKLKFAQLTLTFIALFLATSARAQEIFTMKSGTASIEGTSTLHDWKSDVTNIECKGTFDVQNGILKSIKSTEIRILVAGIKSTKGKIMDNKTYEAFKYKENPYITYTFLSGQVTTDSKKKCTIETICKLSMAGETRKIPLAANISILSNGDILVSASEKIKMTDYKMKPPTAVLGTITVGDEVSVNFSLVLTPTEAQAKF